MHFLKSIMFFFAFDLCTCCSLLWKTLTPFIFPEHISGLERLSYSLTLIAMSRILYMLSNFSNEKLELGRYLGSIFLLFSRSVMSDYLLPHRLQHASFPCPSPSPRACSNSCPLSWWCCPTISPSVALFSSCFQSFPASGSFPMSQFFASGNQSIGASASASVLPMNIQNRFPLTGLISLQSKGLLKISKPQFESINSLVLRFFMVQLSPLYMTTGKTVALTRQNLLAK